MNQEENKEWLRAQIEHYEDLKMWGDLSRADRMGLEACKKDYQEILENEEVKK